MRSEPEPAQQGRHPRQRAEPHRAGHRVRLLLLPRRLRAARRRLRDGHDQLQPGNRVDRLRHGRPVVFPAADVRGRDGGHRDRAVGRRRRLVPRAVRRPDAAQARARAAARGRDDPRHVAGLDRPRRGSRALRGVSLRAQHHAAEERHGHVARGSARGRRVNRIPGRRAAVVRPWRTRDGDRLRHGDARSLHDARRRCVARASGARRQVPRGRVRVRRRCRRRQDRRRHHRRHHGAHRGGRHPLGRQLVRRAAVHLPRAAPADDSRAHAPHRHAPSASSA